MLDDAIEWIHDHVKNIESIETVLAWELSTVLRVYTTTSVVYFKSCTRLPLSADETRLTALLARLYPNDIPDLIAFDAEHNWILMGDVGTTLRQQPKFEHWHQALMRLAELQRDSAIHLDQLLQAGCRDGRPARLEVLIDTLLVNEGLLSDLSDDEKVRLRTLAPMLHRNCQALEQVTICHGDFHGANIGCKDGRLRFFDWSESCICHPFFDLPVMLNDAAAYFSPEQVKLLRDDYLACWEEGQCQWQIAAPVAALHHAMMFNGVAEFIAPEKPRVRVGRWLREILATA